MTISLINATILGYNLGMRNEKGQFVKGYSAHPETQFKKGEHWREPKPYWNKEWLENEYTNKQKTASEIASEWGITDNAICFWLNKHGIKTRTVSETRAIKYWGLPGKENGMYGKIGEDNPNWKGGITDERQAFYSSHEWKRVARLVRKRDKVCQKCGKKNCKKDIHHIVSFLVVEERTNPNNLILLCKKCHCWVHSNQNTNKEFIGKEVRSDSID